MCVTSRLRLLWQTPTALSGLVGEVGLGLKPTYFGHYPRDDAFEREERSLHARALCRRECAITNCAGVCTQARSPSPLPAVPRAANCRGFGIALPNARQYPPQRCGSHALADCRGAQIEPSQSGHVRSARDREGCVTAAAVDVPSGRWGTSAAYCAADCRTASVRARVAVVAVVVVVRACVRACMQSALKS
jgi:hypothetical protein